VIIQGSCRRSEGDAGKGPKTLKFYLRLPSLQGQSPTTDLPTLENV
jgi:hypothetical protein